MLNSFFKSLKNLTKTAKFTYFLRYFAVFTVIFVSMTVIILQVMYTSVYNTSDDNMKAMAEDPSAIVNFAFVRSINGGIKAQAEAEEIETSGNEKLDKIGFDKLDNNYDAILFDENGGIVNTVDNFSGLGTVNLNTSTEGKITELRVRNYYGTVETYRSLLVKVPESIAGTTNIRYAMVMLNTNQLQKSTETNVKIVIMVMFSFWLISVIASIYLAILSLRPIVISYNKQKAFVENASHELRTPLAVLQNRLENLFRKPEATILETSESIASSLEEVRNMRRLTTNLLNLARRDDGLNPEIVDLQPKFFDNLFQNYELVAMESHKTLTCHNELIHPFKSDKILLKQLLTILFDNAIKYTDEEGEIEIISRMTDRYLILRVSDNGAGISDEDKKRIFDRFYRVDKARTRQKGGFGLGLSLAKQIVDSFHGHIFVEDNLPKGTIFEVRLPKIRR